MRLKVLKVLQIHFATIFDAEELWGSGSRKNGRGDNLYDFFKTRKFSYILICLIYFLINFLLILQSNDSGLASYVAGQIDRTLSWKVIFFSPSVKDFLDENIRHRALKI